MTLKNCATVRVGIQVERTGSKIIPFQYFMFHCRQRNEGISDWANDEVGLLTVRNVLRPNSMKVGEVRRYWVHMTMSSYCDYWGEWDSDVEFHSVKRAK